MPWAAHHGRDYHLVPLIEVRQGPFRGQVHLIERSIVTVEIRRIVDGLAVGVIGHQGEVVTVALLHFQNSAMINRLSDGSVFVVLQNCVCRIGKAQTGIVYALLRCPVLERQAIGGKAVRARARASCDRCSWQEVLSTAHGKWVVWT